MYIHIRVSIDMTLLFFRNDACYRYFNNETFGLLLSISFKKCCWLNECYLFNLKTSFTHACVHGFGMSAFVELYVREVVGVEEIHKVLTLLGNGDDGGYVAMNDVVDIDAFQDEDALSCRLNVMAVLSARPYQCFAICHVKTRIIYKLSC